MYKSEQGTLLEIQIKASHVTKDGLFLKAKPDRTICITTTTQLYTTTANF